MGVGPIDASVFIARKKLITRGQAIAMHHQCRLGDRLGDSRDTKEIVTDLSAFFVHLFYYDDKRIYLFLFIIKTM